MYTALLKQNPTEADLHKLINKYEALLQASGTGLWEYDTETDHITYNGIFLELLGRSRDDEDMQGLQKLGDLLDYLGLPEDVAAVKRSLALFIQKQRNEFDIFVRMLHKDGSWRWIAMKGKRMLSDEGKPTSVMLGMGTDITMHKQRDEVTKRERVLLKALIDNLPDTIYIKDHEGRKIISNPADIAVLNAASEADVLGKTDVELIGGEIGERGFKDDMQVLQTGKPIIDKEERFVDANGNDQWILTSKVPLFDSNGSAYRILGIGHNITARKRTEEALTKLNEELNQQSIELSEQAEELKALNEQLIQQKEQEMEKAIAQGKFEIASEVLHDIGNALVGFGSYLNRINRALEKDNLETIKNLGVFLTNQQAAIATSIGADKANALVAITSGIVKTQATNKDEINASVKELLHIVSHIQEILNIQRQFVRSHEGVHERKPVDLAKIIDDCRSMLFASLDKKGIALKIGIGAGKHIVKGDHTKLMQVMLNILKNSVEAIDYEAADKKITIKLATVDDVTELRIEDNGQGFSAETGDHLFERGFTTKKSGTGLGLYNCKSIIESHTGSFEINSAGAGMGSVSVIRFMNTL
jgi:PAS domain S-box-containing protein